MDETESPFPRPLTGSEPDTGPLPSGHKLTGGENAAESPAPAEPSLDEEAPDGDELDGGGWVPV